MSAPLLEVRGLEVEFRLHEQGVVPAVQGVSFAVPRGGSVALVGESGSGKTVISQAIMGILPRSARIRAGQILFADFDTPPDTPADTPAAPACDLATLDVSGTRYRRIRGGRISMIFQEPMTSLSPLHTVGNQIVEAVRLHQPVTAAQAEQQATLMLDRVGFADPRKALRTYPFELSGGLRQRAMIAMALVCRPALLIADEPTTALDVTIQAQILHLIKELQGELGMALLLITHDLGVVANMAEEVAVVYHGKLVERGGVTEIFNDPRHPYLKALMRAVPRLGMSPGERLTPIRDIPRTQSHHLRAKAAAGRREPCGRLLEVRGVSKRFTIRKSGWFGAREGETVQAVADVTLGIDRGECLGLVGESGCGKTTLSKIVMRAIRPDAGELVFHETNGAVRLLELEGDALFTFRRKMQFIFQDPFSSLNPRMTVFDIVSEPLIIHGMRSRAERERIVKELMHQVGLDPRFLGRYPHSFSGGQRQRIGIARALALSPELLICDEPVSALDVSVQAQILNLLKDLQADLGLTYLFISHNLAVVDYMAARIAVMCAGYVVELAPREMLFRQPLHPYTRALLAAVPRTDPRYKLDLDALMEGRVSEPSAWPSPFTVSERERPQLVEVGEGHFVRAREPVLSEIRN